LQFTGQYRDSWGEAGGLDYFGARYFSSAQGRFTSPDPKMFPSLMEDPQSWNKYAYTRNNPLRYVDPDGEDWKDVVVGALNAFGSDYAFGAGRATGGNSDFRMGQAIGDAVATVAGTAEALFGGGGAVVTSPAALTVAGAAIPAAGVAVAVQGTSAAIVAGGHLANAAFSSIGEGPQSGGKMVGANPREAKGRTNTDLPGGQKAAADKFEELTKGQKVVVDAKSGHRVAADGTRLRLNPDGTARVDIPKSSARPKAETVHFNDPDKLREP